MVSKDLNNLPDHLEEENQLTEYMTNGENNLAYICTLKHGVPIMRRKKGEKDLQGEDWGEVIAEKALKFVVFF